MALERRATQRLGHSRGPGTLWMERAAGQVLHWRGRMALIAVALWLGACPHAPPAATPHATQAAAAPRPAPPRGLFLCRVAREGQASYVLGTIHLGFGFEEVLTPTARRAFDNCR